MPSVSELAAGPPQPACISSLGQTVQVFGSKQRPIKITIYGSDFRCEGPEDGVQHKAWHMWSSKAARCWHLRICLTIECRKCWLSRSPLNLCATAGTYFSALAAGSHHHQHCLDCMERSQTSQIIS